MGAALAANKAPRTMTDNTNTPEDPPRPRRRALNPNAFGVQRYDDTHRPGQSRPAVPLGQTSSPFEDVFPPVSNEPDSTTDPGIPHALREDLERSGTRPRSTARTLAWGSACLALILLLGAQVAYQERYQLLAMETLEPWVRAACAPLDCQLPERRDLTALRIAQRQVASHPYQPDALMVTALIENRAGFAQPHPVVELTFMDVMGRPLAARRFQPLDYLPGPTAPIPAGQSAELRLELKDPGGDAVAFEFRFL